MTTSGTLAAIAATVLLGLSSCSVTDDSNQLRSESRQVSDFTAVDLGGSGEVTIDQTGTESLSIEATDKLLPSLTSDVVEGTLRLDVKPQVMLRPSTIRYHVTVKDLTGVTIRGSGSITVPKLATSALRAEIRGSGSVTVPKLTTAAVRTRVSGSGSITAAGTADDQQIAISGSGRYQGRELAGKTATVDVSGSGDADIAASDLLRVQISGSGSVTYYGNPRVDKQITGSGKLVKG